MFTKQHATILSREFKALVSGKFVHLNRVNNYYYQGGTYSPMGWILWQLIGDTGALAILQALKDYPVNQLTGLEPLLNRDPYHFTSIEQLEFIDTEWRMHRDVGDLARYPAMLVSGDGAW